MKPRYAKPKAAISRLSAGREVARPPYPRMLKRVVLGLGEHVQAEHCLDHGRVREGDRLGGIGGEAEGDHWFTFWLKS